MRTVVIQVNAVTAMGTVGVLENALTGREVGYTV